MTAKQTSTARRTNSRGRDAACITTALLFLAATGCGTGPNPVVTEVTASATLEGNTAKYGPRNAIDGTSAAWCVGPEGIGQSLTLRFKEKAQARTLVIRNGYGDPKYYALNQRVRTLEASVDGGAPVKVELEDRPGPQTVALSSGAGSSLQLKIAAVYPGSKYQDTCLTEVTVGRETGFGGARTVAGGTLPKPGENAVDILFKRAGISLHLKKDGSVSGNFCVSCQAEAKAVGKWRVENGRVIADVHVTQEEPCPPTEKCMPTQLPRTVTLKTVTPASAVMEDGTEGEVTRWEGPR